MLLQVLPCLFLTLVSSSFVKDDLQHSVEGWKRLEKPEGDYPIEVTFAVQQTNKEWLERKFWLVSDPFSEEYGNYMNFDEIAKLVYGKEDSVAAIEEALASNGVDVTTIRYTIGKDFAIVKIPVHTAETLFNAEFYHFTDGTLSIVKSLDYTIPSSLIDHVDFVSGINEFPHPNKAKVTKSSNSQLGIKPSSIESAYNLSDYSATNSNNTQAIAGFLGQYFSPDDLEDFQKAYKIPVKPIVKVVGKNDAEKPGLEADLDVEYISAIGRNVDTWFISTSTRSNGAQEDFLSWITLQVNTTDSPWVHSISYGDEESTIPQSYIDRVNTEFQKFGVSGRTVLFASGDGGVECKGGPAFGKKYHPNWPASSPYITSVGGTSNIETVWTMGGGGFSNKQAMPDYQKEAVQKYLASSAAPPTKYFNESGRAYPDVSAFAVNFVIYYLEVEFSVDGTSCATPTFAGVVSLLNDIRLNSNKPTLGFINPLLYSVLKGQGFFDVTKGNNRGTTTSCDDGFKATEGWDPASGWGQPNFGLLKNLVLQFRKYA